MKVNPTALLVALAVAAPLAAGCGDDDDSGSGGQGGAPATTAETGTPAPGSGEQLKLTADPGGELKFEETALSAKAGTVTIVMDNPAEVPHAVSLEGNGVNEEGDTVGKDEQSMVTADVKPGKYTFYCPVPGHEEAGMKGTLTVK